MLNTSCACHQNSNETIWNNRDCPIMTECAYTSIYTMYTNGDFGIGVGRWMKMIEVSIMSWFAANIFMMIKHIVENPL